MTVFEIRDGRCQRTAQGVRVTASVGGRQTYFDISGDVPFRGLSGDAFVAPSMVHAMEQGVPLHVAPELPVSPRLLAGLETYQDVYTQWHAALRPVAVSTAAHREAGMPTGTVGAFFSGGVDGHYTLLRNRDRITHLVLCRGLDIPSDEQARWERTRASVQRTAEALGKRLCVVETNVKSTLRSTTFDNHGAVLVSTVQALDFDEVLVPSSHDYADLCIYGSHPVTDAVLSTEPTTVVPHGVTRRNTKLRALVEAGVDLSELRVCTRTTEYNCGACEKCLRTMAALEALDVSIPSLPRITDLSAIARMELWTTDYIAHWDNNATLAREGGREDLARTIERRLARYRRREALRELDQAWLGGGIARWRGRRRDQ